MLVAAAVIAGGPGSAQAAPGDVLGSWSVDPISTPFGLGMSDSLWVSDAPEDRNYEFSAGRPTGRMWNAPWTGAGSFPAGMAYVPSRGLMCQLKAGGDNGIYCWSPGTGSVMDSIGGTFQWTGAIQRGLAYRAAEDHFYVGGWTQRIIYRIKGLSHPDRGAIVSQCTPTDGLISGLAYNAAANVLWVATNSSTDTVYRLNPDTCAVLGTLPHPEPGFNGGGLAMDPNGNLWMVSQNTWKVFLVESGVAAALPPPVVTPPAPASKPSLAEAVEALPDYAFAKPGLRTALYARVKAIQDAVATGRSHVAAQMLRALRIHVNGCGDRASRDDWIIKCTDQEKVRAAIDDMLGNLR